MDIKNITKSLIYPIVQSMPDFLIIGAQKAGTTSLYNYLVQHPQILGNTTWKEVRYFDLPENYEKGMGWYLGNFPSKFKKRNKLTFDASPSYIYFPHIPQLIKQDLGNIKMIAILREPASRAYSAWRMYHSFADNPHAHLRNIADHRSFPEAIEQELEKSPQYSQCAQYPYDYVARGKYVEQLDNYCKFFNQENLLILGAEELSQETDKTLDKVSNFLEIEKFPRHLIESFKKKKYNVGTYEKDEEETQVIEQLKGFFSPFNQKLYDFLGFQFDWESN
jgi:hypothetical protein